MDTFRRERVTWSTLGELEMSDLVELGLPLGSRKVLMRAIQSLAAPEVPVFVLLY